MYKLNKTYLTRDGRKVKLICKIKSNYPAPYYIGKIVETKCEIIFFNKDGTIPKGEDNALTIEVKSKKGKKMFNFISSVIEYTKQAESPLEYWRWAAISCLSATLRDNVHIHVKIGDIYPNTYIILYSDSGIARKAAPCKFIGKLIEKTNNTKFIQGRASMQAVIKELATVRSNENHTLKGASALLYSEELSSFVVDDPVTVPLLIDLYDFHESWSTNLVSYDARLKRVCISLLAASNSSLFRQVYSEQANTGGLLGRTFIIKEDKPRHKMSLLQLQTVKEDEEKYLELTKHLKKVAGLTGEYKIEWHAEQLYNEWYHSIPDYVYQDKIGYGSRLGTHVLKIAMCLAAAREDLSLFILMDDIEQAIELCQGLRKNYKLLSAGVGSDKLSYQASLILKAIIDKKHISRRQLTLRLFGDINNLEDLDKILSYLKGADIIEERGINMEPGYRLTANGEKMFLKGEE